MSTRLEGRKDEGLFKDLGFGFFPTIAYADAAGGLLAKHEGDRDLPSLGKTADRASAYLTLRGKAEGGDPAAKQHLFVADLGLGKFDYARGTLRLAAMRDIPEALRSKAEQHLIDIQYREVSSALRGKLETMARPTYAAAWNAMALDFFRAGRLPSGATANSVLSSAMSAASAARDVALYEEVLAEYERRNADSPSLPRVLDLHRKRIESLKER